jgi:acyl-coenzyme A synthetase/AMP-(fatty) acid ligase
VLALSDTDAVALVDELTATSLTYGQLRDAVQTQADRLRQTSRSLAFLRCRTDTTTVVNYLAAVAAGHPLVLLDDGMPADRMADLEAIYQPRLVLHPDGGVDLRSTAPEHDLHPKLTLMLTTSGSTGSPKLVRLSQGNLLANARSIVEYLQIDDSERAIASLPFHYSYGLSVLNSHLLAGASVVLAADGIGRPSFWDAFERYRCTSFAGVPYSYAILERTGWRQRQLPSLRTMTQAGGRLEPDAKLSLATELAARGARLVVMYGQTEATARISYVPPERLREKPGAIGVPIPGGSLSVENDRGDRLPPGEEGELVYRGANVMLGYATQPSDLAAGDVMLGVLRTGDLGYSDDDGFLYATRRLARFAKAYGLRVSLDDIEARLAAGGPVAALTGADEQISVFVETGRSSRAVSSTLAGAFGLPSRTFDVTELEALPTTASGKIDYPALAELAR